VATFGRFGGKALILTFSLGEKELGRGWGNEALVVASSPSGED